MNNQPAVLATSITSMAEQGQIQQRSHSAVVAGNCLKGMFFRVSALF